MERLRRLMRPINSMIEFKQIIGRGTRLYDGKDYDGKDYVEELDQDKLTPLLRLKNHNSIADAVT